MTTIYVDVVVLENVWMNAIILIATGMWLKKKNHIKRILLASFVGAVFVLISYGKIFSGFANILFKIVISILMVQIAFPTRKKQEFLQTILLFYFVSFYDTINIKKSSTTTLTCSSKDIPVDKSNTILKTYNILKEQYNITDNYEIFLNKKIPSGAGLGGGSSDAAKFLLAVNKLSNLNLSIKEMENIMAQVGSDTVFFLYDVPMVALGRGEILEPAPILPPLYLLIINPNIFISTKEIYNHPNLSYSNINALDKIKKMYTFEELKGIMVNDMQSVVFQLHHKVAEIVDFLNNHTNGYALMSGSGSTVFAVYENENDLNNAYNKAKEQYGSYFIEKASVAKNGLI